MKQLINTLFVTEQGAYVHMDHDAVRIENEGDTILQVPLINIGGIAVFGNVLLSPALIHAFADQGRSLAWFTNSGRFKARLLGGTTGNVLLRRAQHAAMDSKAGLEIAKAMVAGKIANARSLLVRGAREAKNEKAKKALRETAEHLGRSLAQLENATTLDTIRGLEGDAASVYFAAFNHFVKVDTDTFTFNGRTRRPPRDPVNAVLSFLYGMLRNDCASALEGVGLDPQVGFLHALRPGRPALALDIMEEFRATIADRLALALINRGQLGEKDFIFNEGGSVQLNDRGRKTVISAWFKRKREELEHPLLEQKMPVGLLPHAQTRLLARTLRGDMKQYVPFLSR